MSFSQKEVSFRMISTPCLEVQVTSENRFSVPAWFRSRRHHCALPGEARANVRLCTIRGRLVRGRFGTYEPIDFLARLFGYARKTREAQAPAEASALLKGGSDIVEQAREQPVESRRKRSS